MLSKNNRKLKRYEKELIDMLQGDGFEARRLSLDKSGEGRGVAVKIGGSTWRGKTRVLNKGFKSLYNSLRENDLDLLFLRMPRKDWLVVLKAKHLHGLKRSLKQRS